MTRDKAIEEVKNYENYPNGLSKECRDYIIKALEQEPTTKNNLAQERYQDLIEHFGDEKVAKTILESRKEFKAWLERIRWNVNRVDELDGELEQIKGTTKNDLGVDCVSRKRVLEWLENATDDSIEHAIDSNLEFIPSVTPQEPKCKDCKWWKDSDGEYRRGCGAESICHINTAKVYRGEGYCYLFEPQESEDT